MTVEQLLSSISSKELTEWMVYYQLEPFGEEKADLRMGIISATVANSTRGKGRVFKPQDFIPKFDKPKQTWQEQLRAVEALNTVFHGEDRRENLWT